MRAICADAAAAAISDLDDAGNRAQATRCRTADHRRGHHRQRHEEKDDLAAAHDLIISRSRPCPLGTDEEAPPISAPWAGWPYSSPTALLTASASPEHPRVQPEAIQQVRPCALP
jgi:hypothetical protein